MSVENHNICKFCDNAKFDKPCPTCTYLAWEGFSIKEHDKQIRADAIDEFLIDIIYKIEFEEKWLMKAKSDNADTNVMFSCLKTFFKERAEQLKENEC